MRKTIIAHVVQELLTKPPQIITCDHSIWINQKPYTLEGAMKLTDRGKRTHYLRLEGVCSYCNQFKFSVKLPKDRSYGDY